MRATIGSCSVGPMGPQMPAGRAAGAGRHAVTYSSAAAAKNSSRVSKNRTVNPGRASCARSFASSLAASARIAGSSVV